MSERESVSTDVGARVRKLIEAAEDVVFQQFCTTAPSTLTAPVSLEDLHEVAREITGSSREAAEHLQEALRTAEFLVGRGEELDGVALTAVFESIDFWRLTYRRALRFEREPR